MRISDWSSDVCSSDLDRGRMAADESRYRRMTPRITSLACPLERPYSLRTVKGDGKGRGMIDTLTHLDRLEAESIHIMREVMADAAKPVMLYSVGKDSAVMLHLARKAFFPSPPTFPLLHVDTTWKFQAMYELRDRAARDAGMELPVYPNPEEKALGLNPCDPGSRHTDMWKERKSVVSGQRVAVRAD